MVKQYVFSVCVCRLNYPALQNPAKHYVDNIVCLLSGATEFSTLCHHM